MLRRNFLKSALAIIPGLYSYKPKKMLGDFIMVPKPLSPPKTDWVFKYNEQPRWDIIGRSLKIMEEGILNGKTNPTSDLPRL